MGFKVSCWDIRFHGQTRRLNLLEALYCISCLLMNRERITLLHKDKNLNIGEHRKPKCSKSYSFYRLDYVYVTTHFFVRLFISRHNYSLEFIWWLTWTLKVKAAANSDIPLYLEAKSLPNHLSLCFIIFSFILLPKHLIFKLIIHLALWMGKSYALNLKLPELHDGWVKGARFLLSRHSPVYGSGMTLWGWLLLDD